MRARTPVSPVALVTVGILVACLVLACIVRPVAAQTAVQPVTIYSVDVHLFPDVHVVFAAEGVQGLQANALSVHENGVPRDVAHLSAAKVGVQIAIVMDVAGNIDKAGDSGQPVRQEYVSIITELVTRQDVLGHEPSGIRDQVMLIAPQGPTGFQVLEEWTADYQALYNKAYLHLSGLATEPKTALQTMLIEAMARMKLAPGNEGRPKLLIVLSDGIDQTSVEEITDVVNRAESIGVTILTVKVGPSSMGDARNLQRMSAMTGGEYVAYSGPDSLQPLYQAIGRTRQVYELTYRSAINVAGSHSLRLTVAQGTTTLSSQEWQLGVAVQPPSIEITAPEAGDVVRRETNVPGADPASVDPKSLDVRFDSSFPDGYPRRLTVATLLVNGNVVETGESLDGFTWDLASVPSGKHTLQVEVKDELGIVGRSQPLTVEVDVRIPTPRPDAEIITEVVREQLVQENAVNRILVIVSAGLGGLALIMASYVFIKRPQVVMDMTSTIVGHVKEATELFLGKRGGGRQAPRAYLYVMREDGSLGTPRPITSRQVTLGRHPDQADMVFEDLSVSRYHARIVEESQGAFMIYDEGSTSGTYVNDTEVGSTGHRLDPGDIIYLGRVAVRFSTSAGEEDNSDETQAFQPRDVAL